MLSNETKITILLTKTTAPKNEVALSYHSVRGLYFLAVVFATTIYHCVGHDAGSLSSPHRKKEFNVARINQEKGNIS